MQPVPWVQRLSGPSVEDRVGTAGGRDGPCDHRVPFPAGDVEVEPDRASVVQPHLDELARSAAGLPEVILELIAATRTRSGLRVQAELDQGSYPLGVKVSDRELAAVPLRRHDWHGEWNYTVLPTTA